MAATVVVVVLLSLAGSLLADRVDDWVGHGLGHAVVAFPVAVLTAAAVRVWPPPRAVAPGRLARGIVVVGLAGVATGQVLEALGARVDERGAHALEELAHTAGQVVTMLSMPVLLAGAGVAAVAAARSGAAPTWLVALGVVVATAGLLLLFAGAPGA